MVSINDIIGDQQLSRRILIHLDSSDMPNCALVNKAWKEAIDDARLRRRLEISPESLKKNKLKHFLTEYRFATCIDIYGWSKGVSVPNKIYDKLIRSHMKAKSLVLRGRGRWETCRCPNAAGVSGEQFGDFTDEEITNLESIHISTTFTISACTLIDLISRSPKLKILSCHGAISNPNHNEPFESKRFLSDLNRVSWPWVDKSVLPTLKTIVKRNEKIETFYSDAKITFSLLGAELLPNVRFLSLNLNENWVCKPGQYKRLQTNVSDTRYLSLAKNVIALEVRTFDTPVFDDQETSQRVERLAENHRLEFWKQVTNLPNLKFLAVYGSWELEKVCRDIAKHNLQIEFLKTNLTPSLVGAAIDSEEQNFSLSMSDACKYIKKLPRLKSLHFISSEKFASIDSKTTASLKELMDYFWILDIMTWFTEEVEDLLSNVVRRGNQLGKTYKLLLHIESKDTKYVDLLREEILKLPLGANLRDRLTSIAATEAADRHGKSNIENFHIWGLELVDSQKDPKYFKWLKSSWQLYNEKFNQDSKYI